MAHPSHPPAAPDPRERDYVRPEYIRAAAELPDEEVGRARVIAVVTAGFESEYGAERRSLEDEEAWIEVRLRALLEELAALVARIADLPEVRASGRANADREGGGDRIEIPFCEWQLRDRITAFLCFVASLILLGTSWLSAKASLDDAGLPIFINNEWLSTLVSFVIPASAITAKSASSIFEEKGSKKLYRRGMFAIAGTSFVAYWALFAFLFKSLSGQDDPLADPSTLAGWGFTLLQGVNEVSVATSLMLIVDAIFERYTPDYTHSDSEKERLRRRRDDVVEEIDGHEVRRNAVRSRLAEIAGILAFNLERAGLAYDQARARRTDGLI